MVDNVPVVRRGPWPAPASSPRRRHRRRRVRARRRAAESAQWIPYPLFAHCSLVRLSRATTTKRVKFSQVDWFRDKCERPVGEGLFLRLREQAPRDENSRRRAMKGTHVLEKQDSVREIKSPRRRVRTGPDCPRACTKTTSTRRRRSTARAPSQ